MTHDPSGQIVVTALAAAVAVLYLPDLGRRNRARTRLNAGLHLAMAAGMAAMVWPIGMQVPPDAGAALFGAAAAAYAYQIMVPEPAPFSEGPRDSHHRGVLLWYHLAMMAAMAWMYLAMGLSTHPTHSAVAMPARGTAGPTHGAPAAAPTGGMTHALEGWPLAASWLFVLMFAAALIAFTGLLLKSFTRGGHLHGAGRRRRTAASAGMAAAMLIGYGLLVLP